MDISSQLKKGVKYLIITGRQAFEACCLNIHRFLHRCMKTKGTLQK